MSNLKLKAKIIERFGTQADFARVTGLKEDRISRFINGRNLPTEEEKSINHLPRVF
jgi:plasmid maintenance system antidote protein VapI